jgi:hypothetical protein
MKVNTPKLFLTSTGNLNSVIMGNKEIYIMSRTFKLTQFRTSIYDTISNSLQFSVKCKHYE